jgi:serine/threonine protein kinase
MTRKLDVNLLIDFSETLVKDLKTPIEIDIHEEKTKPSDFKILKKLAKGGYGEVYVVEREEKIYAMKKVAKDIVLKNPNTTFFMNEKEIMTCHNLEWLVKSHICVQDDTHIYYIMDFIHGGDLLGYLSKVDIMKENEIKFYAAEIFTAINEMHKIGWIHRDLKPDNILIDKYGHVKIADFGSCVKMINGQVKSNTTVGTPDYISPDVLSSVGETVVYGFEVDMWTIGVIIYEMFYGVTPFYSESLKKTYAKINMIDFEFPEGISDKLKDLISKLLCNKEKRIDFTQVKNHPFFKDINWDCLRSQEAPFKPKLLNEGDISNFVDTDFTPDESNANCGFKNFIGFTHDPEHCVRIRKSLLEECMTDDNLINQNKCPMRLDNALNDCCKNSEVSLTNDIKSNPDISFLNNKISNLDSEIQSRVSKLEQLQNQI